MRWLALALLGAGPAAAVELTLPSTARLTAERVLDLSSYEAPVAPFDGTTVATQHIEGAVALRAYQIGGQSRTTLQELAPLRAQLVEAGYEIVLECRDVECGGFDFRFTTEILPAPAMYVSLRDFRFVTARKGTANAPESLVTLLVSRSSGNSYIQIAQAGQADTVDITPTDTTAAPDTDIAVPPAPVEVVQPADTEEEVARALTQTGRAILEGLRFATGTSQLEAGEQEALGAVARFLTDNPATRLLLVGHSDATGSLDLNERLSQERADAVRTYLVTQLGANPEQLAVTGIGYAAPIASNATAEGRARNRRVEAVLAPR